MVRALRALVVQHRNRYHYPRPALFEAIELFREQQAKRFDALGGTMVEWAPISEVSLRQRIAQGCDRMPTFHRRLWEAVRIEPEKWELHPHGDAGGGFWVVAIAGRTVIWYNDIEEGFNRSRYSMYGRIDDYWCNQDELETTIGYLMSTLEFGADLVRMPKPPKPPPRDR